MMLLPTTSPHVLGQASPPPSLAAVADLYFISMHRCHAQRVNLRGPTPTSRPTAISTCIGVNIWVHRGYVYVQQHAPHTCTLSAPTFSSRRTFSALHVSTRLHVLLQTTRMSPPVSSSHLRPLSPVVYATRRLPRAPCPASSLSSFMPLSILRPRASFGPPPSPPN